jgi:hypothetical protein
VMKWTVFSKLSLFSASVDPDAVDVIPRSRNVNTRSRRVLPTALSSYLILRRGAIMPIALLGDLVCCKPLLLRKPAFLESLLSGWREQREEHVLSDYWQALWTMGKHSTAETCTIKLTIAQC